MERICVAVLVFISLAVSGAHSAALNIKRSVNPYEIEVRVNRNPLIIGSNNMEIMIGNGSGKIVSDAKVLINYYMPPMPRMAPMNYKTTADLRGNKYGATLNIIMAGPWYIRIIISREGHTVTTKFNMDAQ